MLVPKPYLRELTFTEKVTMPFEPFSPMVWGFSFLLAILIGMCFYPQLDYEPEEKDFAEWYSKNIKGKLRKHSRKHGKKRRKSSFQRATVASKAAAKKMKTHLYTRSAMGDGIMEALMEVVNAGVEYSPEDPIFSRVVKFGWGVFIMIFVASYTANLAAFLGESQQPEIPFRDLDECALKKCNLCVGEVMADDIKALVGGGFNFVTKDPVSGKGFSSKGLSKAALLGHCDIAIIAKESYFQIPFEMGTNDSSILWLKEQNLDICDTRFMSSSKLASQLPPQWVFVGQPARDDIAPTLSYWHSQMRSENVFEHLISIWLPDPQCGTAESATSDEDGNSEFQQLTVENFAGSFFFLGFSIVLAFVLKICGDFCCHDTKEKASKQETNTKVAASNKNGSNIDVKNWTVKTNNTSKENHESEESEQEVERIRKSSELARSKTLDKLRHEEEKADARVQQRLAQRNKAKQNNMNEIEQKSEDEVEPTEI